MYRPGDTDRQYIKYEYVDVLSRTETFRLDNDGTYEFRFFTNNTYKKVATSDRITVSNDDTASCTLDTTNIANLPTNNGPIIAFGDSITFGIGASNGEDYVSELEDRLGVNIINAGVSGDTTRDALERLEDDVLDRNPSAVIIFLGGNDEIRRFYAQLSDTLAGRNLQDELDELADDLGYDWMGVPLIPRQETFDNIETIIERIQDTGAATIVVGFDAAIYDSRIDDNYRQIARETDSFFVADIYDGIFGRPRFMSDLVHPNNAGYDIVADRIQPAVACVI
jgi:lysophospholipase L1-like esterase